ncbi:hypothetical protein HD599_000953 [Conyzicola lurida]|uniref:Phospholipase D-like protein n=1 Tax=Conyzicola lurida TaxID=1172621 RepID=A0A841AFR3_9MICO|nr:SHOCT domain-containing protein [Conyzicola lurida]MBB5842630.1 hypothetical protein [Conyzicola lurida]
MNDLFSSLWNVLWLCFWGVALLGYLVSVVVVLGDLFRDHGLNGWWKAVWIFFLVFLPFLTVLVYVIARGPGIVDRLGDSEERAAAETYDPPAPMAAPASEIARAKELLDQGVITAGEFDALKSKALGNRF